MGRFDDLARRRIQLWIDARGTTKTALGVAAGHNQPWATRWLDGEFVAGLDELGKMAALFGQPISALFDEKPDPREDEILSLWRGLPDRRQELVIEMLRDWSAPATPRGRGRSRG